MEDLDILDMRRLKSGDDEALNQIMQRWEYGLKSFLRTFLRSEQDVEDCAQDTFLKVYTKAMSFKENYGFKSWVLTIAANEAKSKLRWYRIRKFIPIPENMQDMSIGPKESSFLEGLTPEQELICQLKLDGHENKEISFITGINMRKIERILAESRKGLRSSNMK